MVEWLDTRSQSDCLENTMEKKKKKSIKNVSATLLNNCQQ